MVSELAWRGHDMADVEFKKSSFCQTGMCVETAVLPDGSVAMRNSSSPTVRPLIFTAVEWASFVAELKNA
jgi:hypothetical protein